MNYLGNIITFIRENIEENLDKPYLYDWDEYVFSSEDQEYIGSEMGKINADNFRCTYDELIIRYGEPTLEEYHYLLLQIPDICGASLYYVMGENVIDTMNNVIYFVTMDVIDDYNEEREQEIKKQIEERKKAILTIQRAFRKYRYTPCYKFCKLVQMRNMLDIKSISKKEFKKYIFEEKINIYMKGSKYEGEYCSKMVSKNDTHTSYVDD